MGAQVQVDAFISAPGRYLQAIGWRLRGLRVRSKSRLAALAGRSSHAYPLWMARHEPGIIDQFLAAAPGAADRILILVDCTAASGDLPSTLASIAEQGVVEEVLLVGGAPVAGYRQVHPSQVGNAIPANDWICILRPGDRLAPHALAAYSRQIARYPDSDIIYADDDLIECERRTRPHFKPEWNAELFRHHDFVSNACLIRAPAQQLPAAPDRDWSQTLLNAALTRGREPRHIPLVLHHRAQRPAPVAPAFPENIGQGSLPPVTVIIPTRNKADLLAKCMEGLRAADYPDIEVIVVDNGSDERATTVLLGKLESEGVRVLKQPGPFNYSALNNFAAEQARGELLCFLNNDVEMTDGGWLRLMAEHAQCPDIGAVGARLLYPDGTIQHAGVVTGIGGGAGHAHRFQRANEEGYFQRTRLPQQVSAVTAACLVVKREKFLAVGGFDREVFPVAFNDVDLCLKLNARGWHSFYEPRATLIHHESKSRGSDRSKIKRERFAGELAELKRKWRTDVTRDPFHHPCLSPFTEQFLIAV